ncbi:hemerythrin domain-containing protein [Rhizobacter sp. Root1221]|uniref:hemerythrin domain-containing protein n=1 Tax=Rhizobacter sp. Root1221 TaxID=1736433 RepID=UPI0006F4722D|nr:hemerythrin domain-containing protein [Rhizobacter sp. Root1221]KQV98404.1 hypothetical protein ASC87_22335 [Rhizobacter sp. Root1221]
MLAAECAWTILQADHAKMRRLLDAIAREAGDGPWRVAGPEPARLKEFIDTLRTFDHVSHRPKGTALLGVLRGRSPDADRLLDEMELEREEDDAVLDQALARLDAFTRGETEAGAECAALLAQHRNRVLLHLDQEDTLLRAQTEQLLDHEEWAHVVSLISTSLYPTANANHLGAAPEKPR